MEYWGSRTLAHVMQWTKSQGNSEWRYSEEMQCSTRNLKGNNRQLRSAETQKGSSKGDSSTQHRLQKHWGDEGSP
ncbi:hypothetical protein HispidOSU_008425 [Sigmodon hispidus]